MRFRYGKRNNGRRDFFRTKIECGRDTFLLFCTWETKKIRYHLTTIVIFRINAAIFRFLFCVNAAANWTHLVVLCPFPGALFSPNTCAPLLCIPLSSSQCKHCSNTDSRGAHSRFTRQPNWIGYLSLLQYNRRGGERDTTTCGKVQHARLGGNSAQSWAFEKIEPLASSLSVRKNLLPP